MRYGKKYIGMGFIVFLCVILVGVIWIGTISDKNKEKALQASIAQTEENNKVENQRIEKLNFYEKLSEKRAISILIIGDSIGESDGRDTPDGKWNIYLQKWLKDKYGVDSKVKLMTGGGSKVPWGWMEYNKQKDQLDDYDVVFICFGQNDQADNPSDFQGFYESLVRTIKTKRPQTEIIPIIESSIRKQNQFTDTIEQIAKGYNLDFADTIEGFKESSLSYSQLTKVDDGIHPNDQGNEIYAETIEKLIQKNELQHKSVNYANTSPIYVNTNNLSTFKFLTDTTSNTGFEKSGNAFTSSKIGDFVSFKASNSYAILSYLTDPKGGKIKIYVNDNFVKELDTKLSFQVNWSYVISNQLKGDSVIKIETSDVANNGTVTILGLATN